MQWALLAFSFAAEQFHAWFSIDYLLRGMMYNCTQKIGGNPQRKFSFKIVKKKLIMDENK